MEEVVCPSTLRKIELYAFEQCANLKRIELNEGIEEIGSDAFTKCPNLREVHLTESIKTVNRYAFLSDTSDPCNHRSDITLYLSGRLARHLDEQNTPKSISVIIAREFVIDGKRYESIEEYAKQARE